MTNITKFIDSHNDDIEALIRSREVQAHINSIYRSLDELIISTFPSLADTGRGRYDAHESTRTEVKALIFKHYFKHWVK